MQAVRQGIEQFAQARLLACAVCFVLTVLACLASVLLSGIPPYPIIHDEHAHLLAAQTLLEGRLANPSPPEAVALTAMHTLVEPVYASKYPLGQALFLALGILLGDPIFGIWLSMGLIAAATCWMLQAMVPARFALYGGVLVGLFFGPFNYVGQSYYAGSPAALGGILVLGALAHGTARPRVTVGLLLGAGVALLGLSRPFEGALYCLPLAIWFLVWWLRGKEFPRGLVAVKVVLPAVALVLAGLALTAAQNYAITGHPFKLPAGLYQQQYADFGLFAWQRTSEATTHAQTPTADPNRTPTFIQRYFLVHSNFHTENWEEGFLSRTWERVWLSWTFFFGHLWIVLPVAALVAGQFWRSPWLRRATPTLILVLIVDGLLLLFYHPRYVTPLLGVWALLMIEGLRVLNRFSLPIGGGKRLPLAPELVLAVCALSSIGLVSRYVQAPDHTLAPWGIQRIEVVEQLEDTAGRDLVFVAYAPTHSRYGSFVHNGPNPSEADIVWVHLMDAEQNRRTVAAYPDRVLWQLDVDTPSREPVLTRVSP